MTTTLSLDAIERQLDRTHQFFPRIEAKVSALFAIVSGQIAVAILNLAPDDLRLWWIAGPLAIFLLGAAWVMFNLYRCAYPHLEGGNTSLVYFGEIAKLRETQYIDQITEVTIDDHRADVAAQIWRNSEIVCCKYRYLRYAMLTAMLSLIPWAILLIGTALSNGRMLVLGG